MNNKGFTIIELIASIIILSLVLGIGSYSVISIIRTSKQKNYESLISNIKDAVETYVIECKFASEEDDDTIDCNMEQIPLGKLVEYGYLSGNGKNGDDVYTLVNPMDNTSIADCLIGYNYDYNDSSKILIIPVTNSDDSCPTQIDYNK